MEQRMPYRQYKKSYSDCDTVAGTYDGETKSIVVIVPEGRKKKSGVRGQSFKHIWFDGVENGTGRKVRICIKATSMENARKRLPDDCVWELGETI